VTVRLHAGDWTALVQRTRRAARRPAICAPPLDVRDTRIRIGSMAARTLTSASLLLILTVSYVAAQAPAPVQARPPQTL